MCARVYVRVLGVSWVTLLPGSEKVSFKGQLDLEDNGMLDDEGFKT